MLVFIMIVILFAVGFFRVKFFSNSNSYTIIDDDDDDGPTISYSSDGKSCICYPGGHEDKINLK